MTDRELLESIRTQISNHLVMPAAQNQAQPQPATITATLSSMVPKAQFGPGTSVFKVQHAPGQVHLEWVSDKDVTVSAGGQSFSSPPQWSAFLTTEGELEVVVNALGSGTLWMSA